jgi:hypothetical protein
MDQITALFEQHTTIAYAVLALVVFGISYSIRFVVESRRK